MGFARSTHAWRLLSPSDAAAFVRSGAHDAFHLPGYVEASAAESNGAPLYFLYENCAGQVFLPLIERAIGPAAPEMSDLISPYGYPGPLVRPKPGADSGALLNAGLADFVAGMARAGYLTAFIRSHPTLSPPTPGQQIGDGEVHAVRTGEVVLVDLAQPLAQIYRDLRRNHRQNIKRLETLGFAVDHDFAFARQDEFVRLYFATMRRVQAADYYFFRANFFSSLRQTMENRMQLFIVRKGEDIAAAGLFLLCGDIAHYFLAGTAEPYLKCAPSKLLVWKGIEHAQAAGCRWLNLGGGLGGREDALFDFKRAFSKLTAPYHTWRLVADRRTYEAAVARSGRAWAEPSACQSSFPCYRRQR